MRKWGGSMKKTLILVNSNLRGTKGQTIAIIVLALLAGLMLNLWLMLSTDYRQNFDRCHSRLNAEHVMLAVDGKDDRLIDFVTETLEHDGRMKEYALDHALHMVGSFEYNDGSINTEFVFLEKETALSRPVGKVEIVEDSSYTSGIYMPMLYKSEDIAVGDRITVSIGNNQLTYNVCGFFNSVMAGSHNCVMCELVLTSDKYEELKNSGYAPEATLCSVRLKDCSESERFESTLKNAVSAQYPTVRTVSNSYALVSQSRYISQMICSGIISAMAFFILLIALVVIASNIINYIQENMKSLGALKAIGYTSRQLICTLVLQFGGLTLAAAAAGAVLSYCLFPYINDMMITQTGIPYQVRFLPLPFFITLTALCSAAALAAGLSARRIRNIAPVSALRQGVHTHSFRKNHVSLERTKAPLSFALALKTTFSGIRQNLTVCITMLVLSLVVVFSGLMKENIITDIAPFLNLIVGETADSCINVTSPAEETFLQKMESDRHVEKIYLYHSVQVRHVGGTELTATICNDFSKLNNQNIVFEGRFPRYDNEIAVAAKYAREKDIQIGNEITITSDGRKAEYIVSGFTQTSNSLGKDCLLTRFGYERLGSLQNMSYYLNLSDNTDISQFHEKIKRQFGNDINTTIDINATISGSASVYVSLMTLIVIAVLVLSAIIVTFVLYLLVRTMLSSKKKDYGILKALGFTTGQLILQTALSFMPAVILSTVIGVTVCSFIINPLTSLFLNSIGIVKCTFNVPAGFIILAGVGLILFAFAIACLLSLKIKNITPRTLFTGE